MCPSSRPLPVVFDNVSAQFNTNLLFIQNENQITCAASLFIDQYMTTFCNNLQKLELHGGSRQSRYNMGAVSSCGGIR